MPIIGLSEQRRMPRLGKIHLGNKKVSEKTGKEYPSATDYFVCPPEVQKVFGKQPKELPILIPVEDEEYWASQYYRCYSQTRGLVCKGDGESCSRMVDVKSGDIANRDSNEVVWKRDLPCDGRECPYYNKKQCREMMCLQFLLPDVQGVGVYQIDTSSINSIRNINSAAELIRGICGRVRMLPLLLTLEKQEVVNPDDGKKKTVHCLNLRQRQSLQQIIADSQKPVHELLAPAPLEDEAAIDTEEEPTDEEVGQDIDELWGDLDSEDKKPEEPKKPKETPIDKATEAQRKKIIDDSKKMGYKAEDVIQLMNEAWGITATKDLSKKQASALIQFIDSGKTSNEVEELKGMV